MSFLRLASRGVCLVSSIALVAGTPLGAQAPTPTPVERITIAVGRSLPIDLPGAVTQVTITNPDIADIVVLTERSVVLNAKAVGETDILLSGATIGRRHLRVGVYTATDRRQIVLAVKFAEVRREALTELGINGRIDSKNGASSAGTGILSPGVGGSAPVSSGGVGRYVSAISTFGTSELTAYIDAQEQRGLARSLAEPTLMAGNREDASFLAGGELPIPISQPAQGGQTVVTIQYRPFGVQLKFNGEVLSDSLLKLKVAPEVSSLDFTNALLLAGFRVPALRTRKVETTLDVRPGQSLIISGLFNEDRESVRTGIPGLMNIPILGALFSSNRWQKSESELLIIVSPMLIDPNNPPPANTIRLTPDTAKPAIDALKKRIPPQ
ncbi:MAG: pilus assembly protein N-terminal domain-containing protein [Gemmatimonadota bacterium]